LGSIALAIVIAIATRSRGPRRLTPRAVTAMPERSTIESIALSPDGKQVVTRESGKLVVRDLDLDTARELATIPGLVTPQVVDWLADGQLVFAEEGTWVVAPNRPIAQLCPKLQKAAVNHNGTWLACIAADGTATLHHDGSPAGQVMIAAAG